MTIDTGTPTEAPADPPGEAAADRPEDAGQWSAKLRRNAVEALPPQRLMPDRQPAYVASWIYVFGVLTLSALTVVILTGLVLSIMGPQWWHASSTGLFVNSLHLWSVEVFFFTMVIHLWGKFFMAAWRGKRRATWITGVVSFVVSVGAAFTGYLSQQNFDAQWISTQAKDGINSTGAGAIFNVTNFGQMLMWHIVLLPLVVVALVGIHVLLVRLRGVVPPFAPPDKRPNQPAEAEAAMGDRPADPAVATPNGTTSRRRCGMTPAPTKEVRRARRFKPDRDVAEWHGSYRPYDLVKEFVIAFVVVAILVAVLAVIFSSPDDAPVTVKSWSSASPVDFAQTAATELDGTSGTATYGPPYNTTTGASQSILGVSPESFFGVHHPIDTAQDYVLNPLRTLPDRPEVQAAVDRYTAASPSQQAAWTAAYEKAVAKASTHDGALTVPPGDYGPVGTIISSLTSMARSGALDGALLSSRQFYGTDYTKPLLFIADGTYLANKADGQHLSGDQWGMMNETGNYPGQAWLWLYTLWYQVPPINTSANADLQVWALMMVLTLGLALLPFIPGLRSIPRWSRVYRLIWRQYYRDLAAGRAR